MAREDSSDVKIRLQGAPLWFGGETMRTSNPLLGPSLLRFGAMGFCSSVARPDLSRWPPLPCKKLRITFFFAPSMSACSVGRARFRGESLSALAFLLLLASDPFVGSEAQ